MSRASRGPLFIAVVSVVLISGCAGTPVPDSEASTATPVDPMAEAVVDDSFAVDGDRSLHLECFGAGRPVIVFDAGTDTAGASFWRSERVFRDLAHDTEVCAYDRAGLGESDPAPDHARVLDDAVADLDALLTAAAIPGPYVLVGSSGGGFNVYQHAGRHPQNVTGLVMLDVPRGQSSITEEELGGTWRDNSEHMDYVSIEHQMDLARLPIPAIPVTVVAASNGQSADPAEQKVWLEGSSHPVFVTLSGGHEIYRDAPEETAQEIRKVLELARAQ
ncbi:alpha/beta fold hydrolase [Microbacterium sp. SS28]|uniref:alpha/beta fold hydrolase n=1 Tax=Microbacterium sp. SS28 TaxID=2919948 RepID=UPI001FAAF129|nr:alpha/beta hydrolase [Microbacterium sp. SS28]